MSGFSRVIGAIAAAVALCVVTLAGAPPTANGGWLFAASESSWFGATGDLDGDGAEELILSTVDDSTRVTEPLPTYIFGVADGTLSDRSAAMFGTTVRQWSVRTIVTGDFNGDGRKDLFLCNEGRKPVDPALKTNPRTPGIWGEQSQVWFADGDHLVERTSTLPQSVAFCHGASAGDLDKSGRDTIVMNTVGGVNNDSGGYPPYSPTYLMKWNGSTFAWTNPFPPGTGTRFGKPWGFTTATADFNGDGFADIAGDVGVLLGGAAALQERALTPSAVETTYAAYNGTVVGDVNRDGLPDVVKIQSTKAGLAGAVFALYLGDRSGGLREKVDAFPAAYDITAFGIDASIVDINFDGAPDITVFGRTYALGPSYPAGTTLHLTPNAVWLNDGSGRFSLARFTDSLVSASVCNGTRGAFRDAYFLKTADPGAFNLVAGVCVPGSTPLVTRKVTVAAPLTFLP